MKEALVQAADGQVTVLPPDCSPVSQDFSSLAREENQFMGGIFLACLLRVVLALADRVTHLPIGNMKQHFGGLVKP